MTAPKNTCERTVNRLMEIRVDAGYRSPADVDAMIAMIKNVFSGMRPEERVIIAADWRRCTIFGQETAARATAMLEGANPRTLRSSILLLPHSPTTVLQVTRIIREARHPDRRAFTSAEEQIRWLSEITTPEETERLKVFLGQTQPPP